MRIVIATALLASSAFTAHAAEDRYGPSRTQPAASVAGTAAPADDALSEPRPAARAPYAGRLLSWTGKIEPQALEPATAPPAQQPTPAAFAPPPQVQARGAAPTPIWRAYAPAQPQPVAPAPQVRPVQAAYVPSYRPAAPQPQPAPMARPAPAPVPTAYHPQPQPRYQPQPQPQRPAVSQPELPQSLYDQPAPQPHAALAGGPPPQAAAQPVAPQPQPQRMASAGEQTARSYSVAREYGGQPDPIALPPPTSYWATRADAALADPTYGEGLSKKSAEATPREDPDAAPAVKPIKPAKPAAAPQRQERGR